jgi:hypothetical protein
LELQEGTRGSACFILEIDMGPVSQDIIRRLWRADTAKLRAHLLRLDTQSRHDRFGRGVSDDFLTELHFHAHEVTGRLIACRPTPYSLWREASQDVADLAAAIVDAQMRVLFPRRVSGN